MHVADAASSSSARDHDHSMPVRDRTHTQSHQKQHPKGKDGKEFSECACCRPHRKVRKEPSGYMERTAALLHAVRLRFESPVATVAIHAVSMHAAGDDG